MVASNADKLLEEAGIQRHLGLEVDWTTVARAFEDEDRYEKALECWESASEDYPDDAYVWRDRGALLTYLRRYLESIECLDRALELKPDFAEAWADRNKAFAGLDQWVEKRRPSKLRTRIFEEVGSCELRLHVFVKQRLQRELGSEKKGWWLQGIPKEIRDKCRERWELDHGEENDEFNFADMTDLIKILDKNWPLFLEEARKAESSKKSLLELLNQLRDIRNRVMHPERRIKRQDLEFALEATNVIERFTPSG